MKPDTDNVALLYQFRVSHDMSDVYIRDIDKSAYELIGPDGCRFGEIETNIWRPLDGGDRDILYLGTNRHGGGIMLRPLFCKIADALWVNSTTAREAPFEDNRKQLW